MPVAESQGEDLRPTSTACAGFNFAWDFKSTWAATYLTDSLMGQTLQCNVNKLNENKYLMAAKWARDKGLGDYTFSLADATPAEKKLVGLHALESSCGELIESTETDGRVQE